LLYVGRDGCFGQGPIPPSNYSAEKFLSNQSQEPLIDRRITQQDTNQVNLVLANSSGLFGAPLSH
jgi:hypothetical protein